MSALCHIATFSRYERDRRSLKLDYTVARLMTEPSELFVPEGPPDAGQSWAVLIRVH